MIANTYARAVKVKKCGLVKSRLYIRSIKNKRTFHQEVKNNDLVIILDVEIIEYS